MTLRSKITQDPPSVEVTLDDGGSGGRRPHTADVFLSWDPAVWHYVDHSPDPPGTVYVDTAQGVIVWKKVRIPRGGKRFDVGLEQIGPQASFVVATATECKLDGGHSGHRRKTKPGGGPRTPSQKKKEKKKKKAGKKATARKSSKGKASSKRASSRKSSRNKKR